MQTDKWMYYSICHQMHYNKSAQILLDVLIFPNPGFPRFRQILQNRNAGLREEIGAESACIE